MQTKSPTNSELSRELMAFAERLDGQDTTIDALIDLIGDRGFGLLLLMLALPAALPIPAPGYATPFGLMMIPLGLQLARGKARPWLPRFVRELRVPGTLFAWSVRNGRLPLRAVELLIRPRLGRIARSPVTLWLVGLVIVMLAAMMSVPIPLTNTAPSFVIFILAAGILEEDGLVLLGGLLLAPVAAAVAGLAIWAAFTYGPEAVETTVKPLIRGWMFR
jgi:hypothetical protein